MSSYRLRRVRSLTGATTRPRTTTWLAISKTKETAVKRFRSLVIGICLTAGLLTSGSVAVGQNSGTTQHNWPSPQAGQQQVARPGSSSPATQSRITLPLDDGNRIILKGNIHPLARPEYDRGPVPDGLQMEHMLLVLSRNPEQQAVLEKLLDEQQDPSSQNYHLWLTPGDFGQQFGPSDLDIQIVSTWLLSQGFRIDEVARGRAVIEFSGTAGLVRNTFHTELHK